VLLETMSGKGSDIGWSFDELRAIIDGVNLITHFLLSDMQKTLI
jgi:endonuclease IV